MSYICGGNSATCREETETRPDLRIRGQRRMTADDGGRQRFVPDLYRRTVDNLGALLLFPILYPAAVLMVRGDRKSGAR